MTKKNLAPPTTEPGALTHNPFAALTSKHRAVHDAQAASGAVVQRAPLPKPLPACKPSIRHETAGRSGKVVTRIKGLPIENLEAIASRLRKALGCGATLDGNDLLLQGMLAERAQAWLQGIGDLRKISLEPAVWQAPKAAAVVASDSPLTSGTRRNEVRPGQRVAIVMKADQQSGALTEGVVRDILTSSATHPRGIKVRLESGEIGRVRIVLG